MSKLTKARFRRLVAEIISGTAVPRSMGLLGTAAPAWDELRDALNLFGYSDTDEVEQALMRWEESKE